jgi:hypothetical protein
LVNENIKENKRQNIGSIYTMKRKKVKRNHNNTLAVLIALGYTHSMQYKIPIQIENEDTIVAGLSLRQLIIIMVWWGIAYSLFKYAEPRAGAEVGLIIAVPIIVIGLTIALVRVAEMTFLPMILNFIRLSLTSRTRVWSQWTDGFSAGDIGYVSTVLRTNDWVQAKSIETVLGERDEASDKILKL